MVSGLSVSKISINQAVEVPLTAGTDVPVVSGRPGLVRVSVVPDSDWTPREVVAELGLETGQGESPPIHARRWVGGGSVDGDLSTTFNFELPGAMLDADSRFGISLHEASGIRLGPASPNAVRPAHGRASFGAESSGAALRIVLVPLLYHADASGRLPQLGSEQVASHREALRSRYPTPKVEIRVHDPVAFNGVVSPNGEGWGEVLQLLLMRRNQDRSEWLAEASEYYYGLVAPSPSFELYCADNPVCVLGLSTPQADPDSEFARGAVGLGFAGKQFSETLTHEIGHAHGRLHAPCAPLGFIQNVDPEFPHAGGAIGAWGYDLKTGTLFGPDQAWDFMGYCEPAWVSDYTWRALFDRIGHVNGTTTGEKLGAGGEPMWMVSLDGRGGATPGSRVEFEKRPRGQPRTLEVRGDDSRLRRQVRAEFFAYSHLPGGFLLVPEPRPGDRSIRVDGTEIRWTAGGNPLLSP